MANWTTATLLKRLVGELAAQPGASYDPDDIIQDPKVLGQVLAADVIELLRAEVVREAMK